MQIGNQSRATRMAIARDAALATKVNARGTPNFYVNGRNLRGAQPYEIFEDLIKEELAKAKRTCAGVSRARCYNDRIIAHGKVFEPLGQKVTQFSLRGRPSLGSARAKIVITAFVDFQ